MNDFYSREPLPTWRICFYGILAAAGVAAVGFFQDDHSLYYFAAFAGVVIGGFGFALSWTRSRVKRGEHGRFPKWVYWMFWIGLAASSALKLWDIIHKK